jgi:hypothetical protein
MGSYDNSKRPMDDDLECQHCQFGRYLLVDGDKVCDTCYTLAGYRDVGYDDGEEDAWEQFWRVRTRNDRTPVVGSFTRRPPE